MGGATAGEFRAVLDRLLGEAEASGRDRIKSRPVRYSLRQSQTLRRTTASAVERAVWIENQASSEKALQ